MVKTRDCLDKVFDIKDLKDLDKHGINQDNLNKDLEHICTEGLADAGAINTIKAYEDFIKDFYAAPYALREKAKAGRNIIAFGDACRLNTVESYQNFINNYAGAVQQAEARTRRNALAYEIAKSKNTVTAYKEFIKTYPDASEVKDAWTRTHELAFTQAEKENTAASYQKFTDEYPKSIQYSKAYGLYEKCLYFENTRPGNYKSYYQFVQQFPTNSWVPVAMDSLYAYASRTNDWKVLKYCVDKTTGPNRAKPLLYFHEVFTNDGETETLDRFYDEYTDDILLAAKERDYALAAMGDELDLAGTYDPKDRADYEDYIRQAAPLEKAFVALQRVISPDIKSKNWSGAANTVKGFQSYFGYAHKKTDELIKLLEAKYDNSIKINSAGTGVNTADGGEYSPVPSADGKFLYFCGRDRKDNLSGEDIFVSRSNGNSWGKASLVEDLSHYFSNDAPLSVSTDGNTMLLFKSGELFYTEKSAYGWQTDVAFPGNINSGEWQADAMITSDGNALIFAAMRDDGYNYYTPGYAYHGDKLHACDIYISELNGYGQWGDPVNLGPVINSPYCDRSPFLHPDMKTLYFSTDGRGGLGRQDVFKSTRLADTCWDCWSEPVNMGKEINTAESDWGYKITTGGDKAYFAKNSTKDGHDDIYSIVLPNHLRPDLVVTVSGTITDTEKRPVATEMRWEDLETGENVGQSKSNPADGSYFIVLPMGRLYGYYVNKPEYYPVANNIDLRKMTEAREIVEDITLVSIRQMVEEGVPVTMNNIFFDFDKSEILPYSIPELKRVAKIIKTANQKVEIAGHTDSVGDDQYNQVLSEKRAAAVKNFLVSEGCDAGQLATVGYGRSKPVESNESDEGRAKNRRVEMRFVG
jgi:outer membrane protein OmpA-like peptidoglycan-associated protein